MRTRSILAILICIVSSTLTLDITFNQHWKLWKETNNKRYSDSEEHIRRNIWEDNLKTVREHNLKADLGIYTYWLEMNKFADLTGTEYAKMMTSSKKPVRSHDHQGYARDPNVKLPDTVDWRDKGYVTAVKTQGQCTSDWAFSATGSLEGQHFNATGKLVILSEQNLVDCSNKQGNMGCVGGEVNQAFQYVKDNNGIDTEDAYPYEDDDNRCRFKPDGVGANLTSYNNVTSKDENALQQAVANIGPISVAIDASHNSFQLYKQGVYHEAFCSQIHLNLAVLTVGYGNEGGKDYWLVKNSWGENWGEKGYIKMTRNKRNECGIATSASYPIVNTI